MKKWLFLLIGALIAAAAGFGLRYYNVDVAGLTGQAKTLVTGAAPAATGAPGDRAKTQPAGAAQGGQRGNRGPSPVETAKATRSQLSDDISAIGTLLADKSVAVAPETSGRLAKVLFEDGAAVKAGDPLFQLDTDLAAAALAEAKARLELAQSNYGRSQQLRKSGAVAQSSYEATQTERDVARTAVESAEVLMKKLTITAPFPGRLGFAEVSEGAYVTAGLTLVTLDKTDRLKVSFSVPELAQSRIATGQRVTFTADALPGESFTATVSALDPSLDVNGRALAVRADAGNADGKLKPGLLVRVTVKGPDRNAVMVPESAIVQRGDNAFVYTIADNKAAQVKVKTGKRIEGRVEITEGLESGATVVTAGGTSLSDGAAVEVVSTAAAAE
jgi:membrane fusion protein, multidrug efflux system